jgi:hypothetical protein
MEKIALKKLTHSDLTFFQCYYANQGKNPSKQKALNLNSNVLVGKLYPELKNSTADTKIPVSLHIYGPGLADAHVLQRKIVKSPGSKNWRLNGELVYSPEDNPQRYDSLRPNDFALIGFEGESLPSTVFIAFIAAFVEEDKALYNEFQTFLTTAMQKIEIEQLQEIVEKATPPSQHPIYRFLLDEDLIAAVEGDADAALRVYKHSGTVMTSEELATSKQKAAYIGSSGEALVSQYLQQCVMQEKILDFEWTSLKNAIAPYDFELTRKDHSTSRLDVKTTAGKFESKFHISRAELMTMADETNPYALYRVYDLEDGEGKLRIASDVHIFAQELLKKLDDLPDGVIVDSISCSPQLLEFSDPIELHSESEE